MTEHPHADRAVPQDPGPWWRTPWPGAALVAVAVPVMVVASVLAWPDMAAEVVTREAGGRHGASVVPREVSAALLPATLVVLTALFAVVPGLDQRLLGRTPLAQDRSPERARRVLGWTLAGLAPVTVVLHLGVLAMHTGEPFPLDRAMGVALGLLLVALGVGLPLAAPGGRFSGRAEGFRAAQGPAYRTAGLLLVLAGAVTAVAAGAGASWAPVVAVVGTAVAFGQVVLRAGLGALTPRRPSHDR
ncbi:hypothetical protein [Cellulomonas telluris]|uniref:hypothetical protein n=1 Tax=Cellulomonas telluris TaxID=2306636 RepID=UPI0010A84EC0|nr:hypothetical protein [Cellulomonas telluris]